ncbi:MAG: acyl-CoA thioesterase [Lysobacterales bacterium]
MNPIDPGLAKHFVQNRRVLFGECDPAGVLYTPRICEYIIEGALKFVSDCLGQPFERYMFARNLTLPARNFTVDFLRPLTWDDEIEIRAGLKEIRTHAYTVQVTAMDQQQVAFSGTVTQACVDSEAKKLAKLPAEFKAALKRHS